MQSTHSKILHACRIIFETLQKPSDFWMMIFSQKATVQMMARRSLLCPCSKFRRTLPSFRVKQTRPSYKQRKLTGFSFCVETLLTQYAENRSHCSQHPQSTEASHHPVLLPQPRKPPTLPPSAHHHQIVLRQSKASPQSPKPNTAAPAATSRKAKNAGKRRIWHGIAERSTPPRERSKCLSVRFRAVIARLIEVTICGCTVGRRGMMPWGPMIRGTCVRVGGGRGKGRWL